MKREFVISAVGRNVTGIVARVSKVVYNCGCNFEDSRMTLLGNHFALMILVSAKDEKMGRELASACDRLQQETHLSIALFPVEEAGHGAKKAPTEPNYEIRVRGDDRMGIVYRTSQLLAALNINIVELETRLETGKDGRPEFLMQCRVAVPKELDGEVLRNDLKALAEGIREIISLTRI